MNNKIFKGKKCFLIFGLNYGDEGKGSIIDALGHKFGPSTAIRFNGAHQAAHNVINKNIHHCFSHFGSNSLSNLKSNTVYSEDMVFDPLTMMEEAKVLNTKTRNIWERIDIHENCELILPFHVLFGRKREYDRVKKFSTCGAGVGEYVRSKQKNIPTLKVIDLFKPDKYLLDKINFILNELLDEFPSSIREDKIISTFINKKYIEFLHSEYKKFKVYIESHVHNLPFEKLDEISNDVIIFESSQGNLLDPRYGVLPYVTKRHVAINPIDFKDIENIQMIGISRIFTTRHGNGPLITEDESLRFFDKHNVNNGWQGKFRIGHLDLVALKYSLNISNGLDGIALTHIDLLNKMDKIKVCTNYVFDELKNIDKLFFEYIQSNEIYDLSEENFLTKYLPFVKPSYETFQGRGWESKFFRFIREETEVPIKILSFGPKHIDKTFFNSIC